jgi:hypothetical protein
MKPKSQWELYTDEELLAGALQHGLSVIQERQRLRIVQSDFRSWPSDLLAYLKERHSGGLEFIGFALIQRSVILWLKAGNSVSLVAEESMKLEMAAA